MKLCLLKKKKKVWKPSCVFNSPNTTKKTGKANVRHIELTAQVVVSGGQICLQYKLRPLLNRDTSVWIKSILI